MNINRYLTLSYLHKLLTSNGISVGLVAISLVFIMNMNLVGLMLILITALAIPFSIYMLYILYLYDKKSWIYGFLIGLSISFLPIVTLSNENVLLIATKFAPLLFFVLYNMSLKMKVGEWLIEEEFYDETLSG